MNQFMQWFNSLGILALVVLCAAQWRNNGSLNQQVNALEKTRLAQTAIIAERDKTIRGNLADLDDFRTQLTQAKSQIRTLEAKLAETTRERDQLKEERDELTAQRDQLKQTLDRWIAAVHERDAALKQAGDVVQKLAGERNAAVIKFNDLARRYNTLVAQVNQAASTSQPVVR